MRDKSGQEKTCQRQMPVSCPRLYNRDKNRACYRGEMDTYLLQLNVVGEGDQCVVPRESLPS